MIEIVKLSRLPEQTQRVFNFHHYFFYILQIENWIESAQIENFKMFSEFGKIIDKKFK